MTFRHRIKREPFRREERRRDHRRTETPTFVDEGAGPGAGDEGHTAADVDACGDGFAGLEGNGEDKRSLHSGRHQWVPRAQREGDVILEATRAVRVPDDQTLRHGQGWGMQEEKQGQKRGKVWY